MARAKYDKIKRKRPNVSAWHGDTFEESCGLCKHSKREAVEALYLRAYRISELAGLCALPSDVLRDHFDALGLTDRRANNTDAFYARIVDLGLESMDEETAKMFFLRALERKDKLNGRDVLKVENTRPMSIIILAPTQTHELAAGSAAEEQKKEKAGEIVRLLGPGDHGKDH